VKNFPLGEMVDAAFEVMNAQLVAGIPKWAMSQRYDIEAKVAEADVPAFKRLDTHQRNLLWQSILTSRCGLKTHYTTREVSAFVLTVAKDGTKMNSVEVSDEDKTKFLEGKTYSPGAAHLQGIGVPMARFLRSIDSITHSLVVDKTGLNGRFDYDLKWDRDWAANRGSEKEITDPEAGITPFKAVKDQLGLVLTPMKL